MIVLILATMARAANDDWTSNSSGLWNSAGNWSAGVPTATSQVKFNSATGLKTAITLTAASTADSLTFNAAGGANAYTFDTAGTANNNTLTLTSGILNSAAATQTFYNTFTLAGSQTWNAAAGALSFNGKVNLGSGPSSYTLTVNGASAVTIAGVIANGGTPAGNLTYAGTGTLTLKGANTFTGTTSVNSGTLSLQSAGALGTASNISNTTVASGATLQLANNLTTTNAGMMILNGTGAAGAGALQNLSGNNTWLGNITLAAHSTISTTAGTLTVGNPYGTGTIALGANTLTVDGAGDTWFNSNLGVAGDTGSLVKNGTGKLTLWGYNSYYTGGTFVNNGSLDLIVGPFSAGQYAINGALTIGDSVGSAGSAAVNIASNSYVGQISPSSAVTINTDGLLNVGAATSIGSLTLNGGQVSIGSGVTLTPTGAITAGTTGAHQTALISGGTVALGGATTVTVARDSALTSDLTISSVLSGSALVKNGAGILTLSGANTYTGATTVNAGTLVFGASNVLPSGTALTIASGASVDLGWGHPATVGSLAGAGTLEIKGGPFTVGNASNTTFSGVISDCGGYGSLVKQGTGTLTLSGANTYTGATTVNAGVINVQNSSALGASTYGNTVASGAALQLQNNVSVTEGSFGIAGSGAGSTGVIRNISGSNTLNSALTLNASSTLGADAGTLAVTGNFNLGSGQTLTTTGAGTIDLSGALNGSSGLTQAGAGTLILSGATANSHTGDTAVANGTLQLNKAAGTNAIGGGTLTIGDGVGAANSATVALLASNQIADYAGLVTINSDGRLNLNNQSEAINTLAGTGSVAFGTTGYLGVGVNSGSSTFGGSLTGTGVLEKLGSGTLTFNSSFNFGGELRLTSGTVILAGVSATVGVLHITGNTILDFGNSAASTLNATTFLIDSGVTLTITNWVNDTDFFYAQNFTGGTLDLRGTTPENQITFTGSSNNDTAWQSYDHQITPAPEPATYGVLFVALCLGVVGLRRRRAAAA